MKNPRLPSFNLYLELEDGKREEEKVMRKKIREKISKKLDRNYTCF